MGMHTTQLTLWQLRGAVALLALALTFAISPAAAQQWTPKQRAACEPDAMRGPRSNCARVSEICLGAYGTTGYGVPKNWRPSIGPSCCRPKGGRPREPGPGTSRQARTKLASAKVLFTEVRSWFSSTHLVNLKGESH